MHWEKKICFRLTLRRIVGAVVMASIMVNLAIVGMVVGADSPQIAPIASLQSVTLIPTDTPFTVTLTATETFTPTLTHTHTSTPTNTLTPTSSTTATPTLTACVKRSSWPVYRVIPGDTWFSLAGVTDSTVQELKAANCRESDVIIAGELLHVPRLPVTPTVTRPPDTPTGFEILATMTCKPPSHVSFAVRASDPDAILSVSVLVYSSQGTLITEMPLQWNGTDYSGSTSLLLPYTVADIGEYRFRAVDSFQNLTTSQAYDERSRSCIVLQEEAEVEQQSVP
jgi:LysM repeat protein